jgi:PST family polysaccharide transporter
MFIQLGLNMVLSRILTPNDFGIVAVMNVFFLFFQMLAEMGIGPAIIQNKKLSNSDVNSIFTFTILIAFLFSSVFSLIGLPISSMYQNEEFFKVSLVMGCSILFYCLNMVPLSILYKLKWFKQVNFSLLISNLLSASVAIFLAKKDFGVFSILWSQVLQSCAMFLFTIYFVSKSELKLKIEKISKKSLAKIWGFSKNQFLFNFINYFSRNLDSLLIGKMISPSELGYYDKAYQLSLKPNQMLTSVINPVVQPFLSEYQDNKKEIFNFFLKISEVLATIGFSISFFVFLSSEEIIVVMFGNQWHKSIFPLSVLGLSIVFQMISSSTGAIFQSMNRTDLLLKSGIISAICNISAIIVGVTFKNINLVSILLLISFFANMVVGVYFIVVKGLNEKIRSFLVILKTPMIMGGLLFIALNIVNLLDLSLMVSLLLKIFVSVIVFLLSGHILGQWKLLAKIIKGEK